MIEGSISYGNMEGPFEIRAKPLVLRDFEGPLPLLECTECGCLIANPARHSYFMHDNRPFEM